MAAFNWIAILDFVGLAVPPRCSAVRGRPARARRAAAVVLALLAAAFCRTPSSAAAAARRCSPRCSRCDHLPLRALHLRRLFNASCAPPGTTTQPASRGATCAPTSLYCGPSEPTSEYETLVNLAIVLLVIWPLGAPLLFTAVLHQNRAAITERVPTDLSRAAAFLWRDYKPEYWWWESAELLRKLTLTGFVLLIPQEQAMLRLLVAQFVALGALVLYTMCRPFADILDNGLAAVAHDGPE